MSYSKRVVVTHCGWPPSSQVSGSLWVIACLRLAPKSESNYVSISWYAKVLAITSWFFWRILSNRKIAFGNLGATCLGSYKCFKPLNKWPMCFIQMATIDVSPENPLFLPNWKCPVQCSYNWMNLTVDSCDTGAWWHVALWKKLYINVRSSRISRYKDIF